MKRIKFYVIFSFNLFLLVGQANITFPDENNTGPMKPITHEYESLTIKKNGSVFEGIKVNGTLWIKASNVTITDFIVNPNYKGFYGIRIDSGCHNITLEYGIIENTVSSGILGSGFNAYRLNIHDSSGDAIKIRGDNNSVIIEECYIHKLGTADEAHADGIQMADGGSNVIIRGNSFNIPSEGSSGYPGYPYKANAAIFLPNGVNNIIIENNYLNGGGFTIFSCEGVYFRNNYFGRDFLYGIIHGNYGLWKNNRFLDNLELIFLD